MAEFSLKDCLIPELNKNNINFRILGHEKGNPGKPVSLIVYYKYLDYAINTMKITAIHKGIDICRVEAIPELHTSYSYKVSWADPSNGFCFASRYKTSIELIDNIKKTIKYLEDKGYHGGFTICKFDIKDVIFNNPATIVLWADGTKTVVKAENEEFDPEKGLAMAIAKKALGNNYGYYDVFKKYVGKYEKKQKKGGK